MSWIKWKKDSIYKNMSAYVGKTPKQCKSKDQNLKTKNNGLFKGKSIMEIAVIKL